MRYLGIAIIFFASFCCAQEAGDFQPSSTNVWAAQYPRVDSAGRVQIRVKAPDATKVRVNFWSGPKADIETAGWILDHHDSAAGSRLSLLHVDH
jgi:hypothetical protein